MLGKLGVIGFGIFITTVIVVTQIVHPHHSKPDKLESMVAASQPTTEPVVEEPDWSAYQVARSKLAKLSLDSKLNAARTAYIDIRRGLSPSLAELDLFILNAELRNEYNKPTTQASYYTGPRSHP